MKKDVQVGIRMSSQLRDTLKDLAEADKRSLASFITMILESYVAKKGKR